MTAKVFQIISDIYNEKSLAARMGQTHDCSYDAWRHEERTEPPCFSCLFLQEIISDFL